MSFLNSEKFVFDLSCELYNFSIQEDANKAFDSFLNSFMRAVDKNVPFKKLSQKEIKLKKKPWINRHLLKK